MTKSEDVLQIACAIDALVAMSPAQLEREWQLAFGEGTPDVPPSLLARGLAYKMQADRQGDLSPAGQRMLDRMLLTDAAQTEPDIQLKPGSRLIREWQGKLYTVSVTEQDFVLDGRSYGSLSEVARNITGARWSGPRFFGLKRRPPPPNTKVSARG